MGSCMDCLSPPHCRPSFSSRRTSWSVDTGRVGEDHTLPTFEQIKWAECTRGRGFHHVWMADLEESGFSWQSTESESAVPQMCSECERQRYGTSLQVTNQCTTGLSSVSSIALTTKAIDLVNAISIVAAPP